MRDEEDRLLQLQPDAQQLVLQVAARERVERAERLVHQQDRAVEREDAGDGHALAHAAGEVLRKAVGELGEAELCQQTVDLAADVGLTAHLQAEGDVRAHRHPGEERVLLKDHAAIGAGLAHAFAVREDLARRRRDEARDRVQQRRLSAAGGAEEADELAAGDVEVDAVERQNAVGIRGAERFRHAVDGDHFPGSRPRCQRSR